MQTITLNVILHQYEDIWLATIPELEEVGGITFGYSKEEALENIKEVAELLIKIFSQKKKSLLLDDIQSKSVEVQQLELAL